MSLSVTDRLREYALLMRLDKPIGFFLLLWPTLWALLIAGEGRPDAQVLLVFILGVRKTGLWQPAASVMWKPSCCLCCCAWRLSAWCCY